MREGFSHVDFAELFVLDLHVSTHFSLGRIQLQCLTERAFGRVRQGLSSVLASIPDDFELIKLILTCRQGLLDCRQSELAIFNHLRVLR